VTIRLTPTRGPLRAARGGLLAACSAALAVAAHGVAGGGLPDTGLTVMLTLGVAGLGTALAGKRRGTKEILGALSVSHLGMHLILTVLSHGAHGGHAASGWGMLGAHVAGVLLTGVILTRAEQAIFALARALGLLLPKRSAPRPVPSFTVRVVRPRRIDAQVRLLWRSGVWHRGPPVFS
jgi:hypothetical protein